LGLRLRALLPGHLELLSGVAPWRTLTGKALPFGFDSARAALTAEDARVDLAQARRLIPLGCPLETAARILL